MFDQFTERARQATLAAQYYARETKHFEAGVLHLFLGCLRYTFMANADLKVDIEGSAMVLIGTGKDTRPSDAEIKFSAEAQDVFAYARVAAGRSRIGIGDLLSAVLTTPEFPVEIREKYPQLADLQDSR